MSTEAHVVKSTLDPLGVPSTTLAQHLLDRIESRNEDWIALIDANTDQRVTGHQLHRLAQHFASGLLELGIEQPDLILTFAHNSVEHAVALLASVYLGVPLSPISNSNGVYELIQRLADSNAAILLFGGRKLSVLEQALNNANYAPTLKKLKLIIEFEVDETDLTIVEDCIVRSFKQVISGGDQRLLSQIPYFPVQPSDPCLVVYTSGTTGLPKGAVHSHLGTIASLYNWAHEMNIASMIISVWYPFGHISGTFAVINTVLFGFTTVMHDDIVTEKLLKACERYRAHYLTISAPIAVDLVKQDYHNRYDLSSLRIMSYAGSKIGENFLESIKQNYPKVCVVQKYGATEFMGSVGDYRLAHLSQPGNVGAPLPGVEMKVVHLQSGENVATGQSGEVCFRGAARFSFYLNNPKATNSTIDSAGWYHTGDVGHYDHHRSLYIVDRIKELIKYKHYSVSPAEIEAFLLQYKGVEVACVVGVKHVAGYCLLRAYVQADQSKVTSEDLIQFVKDHMGSPKQLRAGVCFVDHIPRTIIGKVDREYFKKLVQNELLEID